MHCWEKCFYPFCIWCCRTILFTIFSIWMIECIYSLTPKQGCPNPVSRTVCGGPRVVSRWTSSEIFQETKSICLCFNLPPAIKFRQKSHHSALKTFFLFGLPPVFETNPTRNQFLLRAGNNCAAPSKSLLLDPQKFWPLLLKTKKLLKSVGALLSAPKV